MPTINWANKVITVPQSELTLVSGSLYEFDVNAFRLALKDIEDGEEGMVFPNTHSHNTQVVLSGVTYARSLEIVNGYTVTFEDGSYTVRCVGANHNLADVKNVNSVSLIVGNSAGLQTVATGSGPTPENIAAAVWAAIAAANNAVGTMGKKVNDATANQIADEVQTRLLTANVTKVNGVTVIGDGQPGTEWGP